MELSILVISITLTVVCVAAPARQHLSISHNVYSKEGISADYLEDILKRNSELSNTSIVINTAEGKIMQDRRKKVIEDDFLGNLNINYRKENSRSRTRQGKRYKEQKYGNGSSIRLGTNPVVSVKPEGEPQTKAQTSFGNGIESKQDSKTETNNRTGESGTKRNKSNFNNIRLHVNTRNNGSGCNIRWQHNRGNISKGKQGKGVHFSFNGDQKNQNQGKGGPSNGNQDNAGQSNRSKENSTASDGAGWVSGGDQSTKNQEENQGSGHGGDSGKTPKKENEKGQGHNSNGGNGKEQENDINCISGWADGYEQGTVNSWGDEGGHDNGIGWSGEGKQSTGKKCSGGGRQFNENGRSSGGYKANKVKENKRGDVKGKQNENEDGREQDNVQSSIIAGNGVSNVKETGDQDGGCDVKKLRRLGQNVSADKIFAYKTNVPYGGFVGRYSGSTDGTNLDSVSTFNIGTSVSDNHVAVTGGSPVEYFDGNFGTTNSKNFNIHVGRNPGRITGRNLGRNFGITLENGKNIANTGGNLNERLGGNFGTISSRYYDINSFQNTDSINNRNPGIDFNVDESSVGDNGVVHSWSNVGENLDGDLGNTVTRIIDVNTGENSGSIIGDSLGTSITGNFVANIDSNNGKNLGKDFGYIASQNFDVSTDGNPASGIPGKDYGDALYLGKSVNSNFVTNKASNIGKNFGDSFDTTINGIDYYNPGTENGIKVNTNVNKDDIFGANLNTDFGASRYLDVNSIKNSRGITNINLDGDRSFDLGTSIIEDRTANIGRDLSELFSSHSSHTFSSNHDVYSGRNPDGITDGNINGDFGVNLGSGVSTNKLTNSGNTFGENVGNNFATAVNRYFDSNGIGSIGSITNRNLIDEFSVDHRTSFRGNHVPNGRSNIGTATSRNFDVNTGRNFGRINGGYVGTNSGSKANVANMNAYLPERLDDTFGTAVSSNINSDTSFSRDLDTSISSKFGGYFGRSFSPIIRHNFNRNIGSNFDKNERNYLNLSVSNNLRGNLGSNYDRNFINILRNNFSRNPGAQFGIGLARRAESVRVHSRDGAKDNLSKCLYNEN